MLHGLLSACQWQCQQSVKSPGLHVAGMIEKGCDTNAGRPFILTLVCMLTDLGTSQGATFHSNHQLLVLFCFAALPKHAGSPLMVQPLLDGKRTSLVQFHLAFATHSPSVLQKLRLPSRHVYHILPSCLILMCATASSSPSTMCHGYAHALV